MRPLVIIAVLAALLPARAGADALTLACLDVGRVMEACRSAAGRFEAASGNSVRVVAADVAGRASLELYRALFDVASPRLDVLQLPDAWMPALRSDLATLPEPTAELAPPALAVLGRDGSRLVAMPQLLALMPAASGSELRDRLAAGPSDGVDGLDAGAAEPTLFPAFLQFAMAAGAGALDDRDAIGRALAAMDAALGGAAVAAGETAPMPAAPSAAADSVGVAAAPDPAPVAPGAAAAPEAPSDGPPVLVGTVFVAVSRHSASPGAATALAQHLVSEDEERRAALEFGIAPARPALYREADVLAAGPAFRTLADALPRLAPPPVARFGAAYLDLVDDVAAAVRRMLRGEADPEPTASAIVRAARRAAAAAAVVN